MLCLSSALGNSIDHTRMMYQLHHAPPSYEMFLLDPCTSATYSTSMIHYMICLSLSRMFPLSMCVHNIHLTHIVGCFDSILHINFKQHTMFDSLRYFSPNPPSVLSQTMPPQLSYRFRLGPESPEHKKSEPNLSIVRHF